MNGRRLYKEYARETQGVEATEFVKIENDFYHDWLFTKNSKGELEKCIINYRDMVHWIIRTKKIHG